MSWLLLLLACGGSGETAGESKELVVLGYTKKDPLKPAAELFEGQEQPGLPALAGGVKLGQSEEEASEAFEKIRETRVDLNVIVPDEKFKELAEAGRDKLIGGPLKGYDKASLTLHFGKGRLIQLDLSLPAELETELTQRWKGGTPGDGYTEWIATDGSFVRLGPAGDRCVMVFLPPPEPEE